MTKVDLLIFDFDGTLADTGADLAASINHTLTALRMDPRPPREIL
ncbi:MAG: HAD hydrolase-like protein, partial [Smithella sp.]